MTQVAASETRGTVTSFEINSETGRDVRRELASTIVRQGWGLLNRPLRMSLEEIFLHLTTEETAHDPGDRAQGAEGLLRRSHVVIGFFAILFGWFFINLLYYFDRTQMQAGSGFQGPQAINVNEIMISPLFLNVSVILLFTLPLITMRTYAEEKRSGTIELLLTSPLTDLQIVMGKGLARDGAMLAVTLHMAILFAYGNPEWRPIATGISG